MSTTRRMTAAQRLKAAMIERFNLGLPLCPIPGFTVTYKYGEENRAYMAGHHTGEDYSTRGTINHPVVALRKGVVVSQDIGPDYGRVVAVEFKRRVGVLGRWKTYRAYYCHLNAVEVRTGQRVDFGTRLGLSGNTGNTTGPHLHLEVRRDKVNSNGIRFGYGTDVHPFLYKRKWKGVGR